MTRAPDVSRLDRIIAELKVLHDQASDILDAHVDVLCCQQPGIPFGVLKSNYLDSGVSPLERLVTGCPRGHA